MLILPLVVAVASFSKSVKQPPQRADFLRTYMDASVNPGLDFFSYGNGGWLKRHPIPPTESSWGISNLIRDQVYGQLRKIDESAANRISPSGSDIQKVGDFWATGMDQARADRLGLSPLKADLSRIDGAATVNDCVSLAFELQRIGVDSFVGFSVEQDEKRSDLEAVHLSQGGLGLPERDFYFNPEAGVGKVRLEYVKYLQAILGLAGSSDPKASADSVMTFETSLAKVSRKLEDLRDPESNYNRMLLSDVQAKLTPSIDWQLKLKDFRVQPQWVIVGQPEFFKGLDGLLAKTSVETLRDYMRFHLIDAFAPYLDSKTEALSFHFNHEVLSGQKKPQPRWKRVLAAENQAIGFVLGRAFVTNYFPPSAKVRSSNLVEAIRQAYAKRIKRLDWMSAATKTKALEKLAALHKKVGYPDKWKNYSTLIIGRNSFCENMMNSYRWNFIDMVSRLGKPVDKTEWDITPQTFDAYYDPSKNEIVLPAVAFDIPGLKESQIDDAVMYGNAGGSWIGHEMTHGFDDQGRQFDPKGNLKDWWTKEDAKKFQARAQLMVKQFDAYEPLPGLHINGKASLGENIADFGGVLLGLDAFKQTDVYKRGKRIGGLTPVQRYFLAYSLSWLDESRPEGLRRQLLSDVHAPAKWRVNGPLSNIPDFYKAFGVKPRQPMWRAPNQRVHIW
jgi:putative endopeptidase